MITEEQVLNLWNHSGLRSASVAKPRMVSLSAQGDNGLIFGNFLQQKYFFVEKVWFAYVSATKPQSLVDCYLQLYVRPNEITVGTNNPVAVNPVISTQAGGSYVDGLSLEPYVFARQATFVQASRANGLYAVRLLIWEIEE